MSRGHALMMAAVLATVLGAGCGRRRDQADPPPPPAVSVEERTLATDACGDYVAKLCACAQLKPELGPQCKLKHAKIEALALTLAVVDDRASSADSVARARAEMAKIVARCVEEAAQLPMLGCR